MSTLQEQLLKLGFLDVTGFVEWDILNQRVIPLAPPDKRLRRDVNMGVRVIVDEYGHSWIQPTKMNADSRELTELQDTLQYGTYVPYSNDGGAFIRKTWPWLFNEYVTIIVKYTDGTKGEKQILRRDYNPQLHGPAKTALPESHRL